MKGGPIIYWLSRFLPDDWKGILGVLIGVILLVMCCVQFVNRKNGSAVLYLLFGGLFVWLGMGTYNDSKPYAKEHKLLAEYGQRLAVLARDTSPQELSECRVKSVEVYERAYSNERSLFGKVHLHVVNHGLTVDVPVDTSWNATNGEWQSVAEAELKLLALDQQLMQIDRAKRTLKSLGVD